MTIKRARTANNPGSDKLVTSGAGCANERVGHYTQTITKEEKKLRAKLSRQRKAAERRGPRVNRAIVAAKALSDRILDLFSDGFNTLEIAAKVNAKESKVYNVLARLSE